MFRILFYAFLFYMLYKLVFDFILPVYRTTRQVKKGFREMNERMRQQTGEFHQSNHSSQSPKVEKTQPGDYIDFEEVKD
jgi:hypothetical protein